MMKRKLFSLLLPGILCTATAFAQTNVTITKAVTASTDDVEENTSGTIGSMYLNSSDLELMTDGTQLQTIGVRFNAITVPQGATIQHAYIQFATKGDKAPVSGAITIKGQNADNAATFTSATSNLSSRPVTTASISWPGSTSATWGTTAGGTQGAEQRTPDLKTIAQAVVSRAGWASGNSLVFVLTGTGVRNAYAYDGSATLAPQLILEYTTAAPPALAIDTLPIAKGSQWRYNDSGISLDAIPWTATGYNDSLWSSGPGKLGYSDNAVTTLEYGPNSTNKYITYYFRKKFNVPSLSAIGDSLEMNLLRDDGAIVYINGTEVVRSNMPAGATNYLTFSSTIVDGVDETTYYTYHIPKSALVAGINTIAVELHQRDGTSSDLGFDMELKVLPKPTITRGPYLQLATTNSIHLRWRTDQATGSRVRYGLSSAALTSVMTDTTLTTEHEVVLSGLGTHTKYWYSIGSNIDTLQGDTSNYFITLHAAGDTSLIRIGVIGDCGNNSTNQINVRNQVINYLGSNYMDNWILLGDNAYDNGSDAQFQAEFFNVYRDRFLKQSPLFPAPGNHDYDNLLANQVSHAVPYYNHFSLPTQGEAGGVASNNEAYYSFDQGNVHFLSLDSYGEENAGTTRLYDTLGAQVQWIKQDLAANTNKGWVVAYWHHPPYTMGSHNSDNETELVKIRQNFIRILERMGVDLILCGHSHDYERSKLMQGHYGNASTFSTATNNISQSSGLYDGSANSCPYIKDSVTQATGTVYVVSGSAGQLGGTQGASFPHPALSAYSDATHGGAMMLEVRGNRLDAKWICADGTIRDHFTMMKNTNFTKTYTINTGDSVQLTAGFNGVYSWSNNAPAEKVIKVAPADTTLYVVTDNNNCVSDSFKVNVIPANPLPVRLIAFGAIATNDCTSTLDWQAATEHNSSQYVIEYSADGKAFQSIGTVASRNSTTGAAYRFVHNNPAEGVNYYRLKMADLDGSFTYSAIATDRIACDLSTVTMSPNPVSNSLTIQGLTSGKSSVIVYNSLGSKVQELSGSGAAMQVDVSALVPGTYTIKVLDSQGRSVAVQSITKK